MTISTTASRISHNGNGVTTAFSFPYRFLTNADLTVIKVAANGTETTLVLNTDYTVSGADNDAGGTVTIGTAPASGTRIVIFRSMGITQEVDYITGDSFPAETHERALDRLTMIAQQQQDAIDRSAKLPETSTEDADALIADIIRLADSADNVDTVAGIEADVSAVAAIDSNVTTVAGIAANVTTVAGIAANVTSVAGNATNINAVAGNATNINAVNANKTNIDVVAANETNIDAVAANETNIDTVAGISANVTTVAGISAAVTAVAADATDIGTVAADIADINTCADNIAAILDAPTQATNASNSAIAAAASAAAAAASYDSFDDRYLGSKSSDPTVDNDGNALVTGALYYNTTTQTMKVYDGANWIAATAAGTTSMLVYKYVATAGQTTFSGAATVGGTMSYTSGNIIVFVNGAALDSTDYTATNGTSVVLTSAASLNDEVVVVAFKSFTVADALAKTGGTLSGDLTLDNGNADGAQLVLNSSGYSSWNLDNYSGRLRAYYGSIEYFTINSSGNVGIGTSSPGNLLEASSSAEVPAIAVRASGATRRPALYLMRSDSSTFGAGGRDFRIQNDLGALTFSDGLSGTITERVRIDSSGNLLVATTNPAVGIGDLTTVVGAQLNSIGYVGATRASEAAAYFTRTGSDGRLVHCYKNSSNVGGISVTTSATSFNTSSDYRLKENIAPMTGALAKVAELKPVTYTWKVDGSDGQGFIAHELQEVIPDCVTGEKDAVDENGNPVYQGIDTSFLVATLTAAIQEQQALITTLTERITALEAK